MANEKRLIDAYLYEDFLRQYAEDLTEMDAPMIAGAIGRCISNLNGQPTVDAVEVENPELLKAIKMLIKQYDHSKKSDFVHNPIAHAFYYTWKELDESGYGERR